jgi:hypothetical protein
MHKKDLLKRLRHRTTWQWDHPFPGDIGEDGRWELSLYHYDDLSEDGYAGYVAIAPLRTGEWAVIFLLEGEETQVGFRRLTLSAAKASIDLLLAGDTPPIPADRDAADPWRILGEGL